MAMKDDSYQSESGPSSFDRFEDDIPHSSGDRGVADRGTGDRGVGDRGTGGEWSQVFAAGGLDPLSGAGDTLRGYAASAIHARTARRAPRPEPKHVRLQKWRIRQHQKHCAGVTIIVPETYAAFVEQLRRWVALCVMSRTLVNGRPIKREDDMIIASETQASMQAVWALIKSQTFKRMFISAQWHWPTIWRPESVTFYLRSRGVDFDAMNITSTRPNEKTRIAAMKYNTMTKLARVLKSWVGTTNPIRSAVIAERVLRFLTVMSDPGADDRYIEESQVVAFLNSRDPNDRVTDYVGRLRHQLLQADFIENVQNLLDAPADPLARPSPRVQQQYTTAIVAHLKKLDRLVYDGGVQLKKLQTAMGKAKSRKTEEATQWVHAQARKPNSFYDKYKVK